MKKKIKIGVLGGIGPEATIEFYSKLIFKLQNKKLISSNKDFPNIIINSIPASELIYEDIPDSDLAAYIRGLKELDSLNPDFIVMVCNTIHLFYGQLQKEIKAPILNLREIVLEELNKEKLVTILGSPLTINKLYAHPKIKTLNPTKEEIKVLTESVFNFNRGHEKNKQINNVKSICNKYLSLGSKKIVLACTELAVMLNDEKFPVINTIDLLVKAAFNKYQELNNKV